MQAETIEQLTLALSRERLASYRGSSAQPASDASMLVRYAWNTMLSESLYPSLQMLEVGLRNTIHNAMTREFGREDWFDKPDLLRHHHDLDAIRSAKAALTRQRKSHDAFRVVAEVKFGFWTSLLDKRYERALWQKLLKTTFPHVPRSMRTRKVLSVRFNALRELRNRVFHHEPIWHWQDLMQHHRDLIEAIGWINPVARDLVCELDRFPDTFSHGQISAERSVCERFQVRRQTPTRGDST